MDEPKGKVNWTLDQFVIRAVREDADRRTAVSGVKVSESAAANAMLTEYIASRQEEAQSTTETDVRDS
jgi:hypothetical protein